MKAILLCALVIIIAQTSAETNHKSLIDVSDRLQVLSPGGSEVVEQFELKQFPYTMAFNSNTTIGGELCYALDIESF